MRKKFKFYSGIILVSILAVSISACCTTRRQTTPSIEETLTATIRSDDVSESMTALILLSNLALSPPTIQKLDKAYEQERDPMKKLFVVYVLAKRTQEKSHVAEFVELYPEGEGQIRVWAISRNQTNYISMVSALHDLLFAYARNDGAALKKLLSGYPFSDGAIAEIIEQQLLAIYENDQTYFRKIMGELSMDLSEIGIK